MNRPLLLVAGSLAAFVAAAQSAERFPTLKMRNALSHDPVHVTYGADRVIIWEDDFSVASNWTIDDIADPNDDHWTIGTGEPQGTFSSTYGAIESTSAANGFALFDSDFLCGGEQQAYVQNAVPIDLSAYPGAILQFEQYFTRFRGDTYVDVSANGTDWTEYEVNDAINVNASTDNPLLTTLNISSVVAGQSTVWIRFRYYSTVSVHGPGSGCDYAWMVDDVAIVELQPYDLVMNYGVISHTGDGLEYGRVPTNQLNPEMNLGGQVHNFGSLDQTGVNVHIVITDMALTVFYDGNFPFGNLPAGQTFDLDELVDLPVLPEGIYDVSFTASSNEVGSDANISNNTVLRLFAIDEDVYALDGIDVFDANDLTAMGSTSFAGAADGLEIMTYFQLATATTIHGVSAELAGGTEVNSAVLVSLHDTAAVFAENLNTPLAQSDVVTVMGANLASGRVTGLFPGGVVLGPGGYYASVRLFSNGNVNDIFVLDDNTVPQPGSGSLIYDPSDGNVYNNGNANAVRLQLNPSVGVNETNAAEAFTLAPNPTTGAVRLTSSAAGPLAVEVCNALGAVVLNHRFTGSSTLDLGHLATGIYSVRVGNGTATTVQRIAVEQQ